MNSEANNDWTGPGQRVAAIEIDTARVAKLERLLVLLGEWRTDPSSVRWQPIQRLVQELNESPPA